jgi:GAF domain-containing protein
MTAPPDDTTTDLQAVIAALRVERDALAEALARRNSEYGERIEQQAATIDVLQAMSASPGDAQPVFDLIVERARDLCEGYGATVLEFDGRLLLHSASTGIDDNPAIRDALIAAYPKAPERSWPIDLAVLERRLIIVDDLETEPNLDPALRNLTHKSVVAMPLMRGEVAIGALALGGRERGGFSGSQIELLKTFAEQAVIAITSAETYRAFQSRTSDLQESLEYQTATSDVLKVISRSTFDLQPVLDAVVETAARLCDADMAHITRREGEAMHFAANYGFPPEYETYLKARGPAKLDPNSPTIMHRTWIEGRPVHVDDVAAVPGYPEVFVRLSKQRTSLAVPLLRGGETIGVIQVSRQRVQPFTDRQIDLVRTFADQAVIAIENTRLMTEQREALEQQTATAEVLQVINGSPGNLTPVFNKLLEKALGLCGAAFGMLEILDGDGIHTAAHRGVSPAFAEFLATPREASANGLVSEFRRGERFVHRDVAVTEGYRSGVPIARALVDLEGGRTVLAVPLLKEGELLGVIVIYRREVRPFSTKQIALLQNFAAQAVIAMENARLLTEQREALEQQTATAEVLQVINASPGDLGPVFDAILKKAHILCGAEYGVLLTYDGEVFWPAAVHGDRLANSETFRRGLRPGFGFTKLIRGERLLHIHDMAKLAAEMPDDPVPRALFEISGIRTQLAVPLRREASCLALSQPIGERFVLL